jgi:hypothetical protein
MPLISHSQEDFFIVPSILREFLSPSFQAMDEPLFVSSRRRLILIQDLVAEVKTALPRIRARLGDNYLPTPPKGSCLDELGLSTRSIRSLASFGIGNDANLIGLITFNHLLSKSNFGVTSLIDVLIAVEYAHRYFDPTKQETLQSKNESSNVLSLADILVIKECLSKQIRIPRLIRGKFFPKFSNNFKFDRLTLKNRTYNRLDLAGFIRNPQELSKHTVKELLNLPAFGNDSLLDLLNTIELYLSLPNETLTEDTANIETLVSEAKLLEQMQYADSISADDIRLGQFVRLINPSAQNALDAAETLLDGEYIPLNIEAAINQIRELRNKVEEFSNLKLEDEILSLLSFVKTKRNLDIFIQRYGLNGREEQTLQEVGDAYNMTRERVRQICDNRIEHHVQNKHPFAPTLDRCLNFVFEHTPNVANHIEKNLQEKGLTNTSFSLESLQNAARLFGREVPYSISKAGKSSVATKIDLDISPQKIIRIARRKVEHWGATTIEEVAVTASEQIPVSEELVLGVLNSQEDFSWLDKDSGWFWLSSVPRNRLLNQIEKILSVIKEIDIAELRDGVRRNYRMEGFAPPQKVLLEFCNQQDGYKVEGRKVSITKPIDWHITLAETEQTMVEILLNNGSVMKREDFERACLARGMGRVTFYVYIDNSPVITRYARGVYGLRGANIPPGLIESLKPRRTRGKVLQDYGWTEKGEIWLGYRLSESTILNGVCSIPAAMQQYINGDFNLKSSDGSIVGNLVARDSSAWGIGPIARRKGAEEGDYMTLVFDLSLKTATMYLGDESLLEKFQPTNP